MPIYEYSCGDCGHVFELMQTISAEPIRECPSCKQGNVQKMMSNNSFVLKGSGWYVTDYKKGVASPDKAASSDKAGSSDITVNSPEKTAAPAPAPVATP